MPKTLPALKPREVLRVLMRMGFYIHHQTGSHAQLRHPKKPRLRVTIPRHEGFDLPKSLVRTILKQAEVTVEEFLELL